ncbi:methionine ABC transporter ATP-binding protein MetN [Aliagarivorans taiwanensis]|uniref:methionine ABC transporter ATP-binding protein MetN n=1 Tax=Aliagarivorans taiwanensis TaxID=561966 RepID=UPI0003FFAE7B|nr:methionine ABC transporter ATP-binding protein MetN [Aliagarivorans taiwanensis]
MIELKQVSKTYTHAGRTVAALRPLDLQVERGEIFGIIGSSGAGKSTLIRCVNLLERPDGGQVLVDGLDLTTLPAKQLRAARQDVAMIFQHFNLLNSRTVFGNVALPLELAGADKQQIANKVASLLELVGLADKANSYPAMLSGGQKQRVAIARALAVDPKVLLCDEATSALDPETTSAILDLLKRINQQLGLTILLITHEMDVVKRICDKVAIIDDGALVEQGPVGEFFANAKTELAKRFIASTMHLEVPASYQRRLHSNAKASSHPLVKLSFRGDAVDAPVISQVARKFNIDLSIVSAQMDYLGGNKFGLMLVELSGEQAAIQDSLAYFEQHNITAEVVAYVD